MRLKTSYSELSHISRVLAMGLRKINQNLYAEKHGHVAMTEGQLSP